VPSLEQLQAYVDGQLAPEEMTQVGIYLTLHPDYAALVETLRNPDTVLSRAWNEKLAELVAAEKK
jgi:anti-sigma factor RsiW